MKKIIYTGIIVASLGTLTTLSIGHNMKSNAATTKSASLLAAKADFAGAVNTNKSDVATADGE